MLKSIPIRLSIILNILFIAIIGFVLVISVQYYHGNKLALSATEKLFRNISRQVAQKMIVQDERLLSIFDYLDGDYLDIQGTLSIKPELGKEHPVGPLFGKMINNMENIYAVYIGYPDGSFYEVINMHLNSYIKSFFDAPDNSRWVAIKIIGGSDVKHIAFLDEKFKKIYGHNHLTDYDPRTRPWYKSASKSKTPVRTSQYTFAHLPTRGVSYAKKLQSGVTLGIDFTVTSLSEMLDEERIYDEIEIYILNSKHEIVASSSNHNDIIMNSVLNSNPKYGEINVTTINKVKSLTNLKEIGSDVRESDNLILYIPYKIMVEPYSKIIKVSFYVTMGLIFVMLPVILLSTNIIVRPLKCLMRENELIRRRKFKEVQLVDTRTKEYQVLSRSMVNMAQDIESFQLAQQNLFDSFVKLITEAIDDKSNYTGSHCKRVPVMAELLTRAASDSNDGIFADFKLEGEQEWRELHLAAWLHDCGKLITPEYVVDKATKLETIYNRIHEIRTRFEVIWRDIEIEGYKRKANGESHDVVDSWLDEKKSKLTSDFEFIAEMNSGDVFVTDEHIKRLDEISRREWVAYMDDSIGLTLNERLKLKGRPKQVPRVEKLLDDKPQHLVERRSCDRELFKESGFKMDIPEYLYNYGEIHNLSIKKGTLTDEERFKINEHIIMSTKMLSQLPFPDHLRNVTEYAVSHHETMIGTGYPRKLKKEEMSIPARIMAVADIFEALTASDRPYKKPNTLSESIRILSFMAKDQHIDSDIFKLFVKSGVYKEYAKEFLNEDQIDDVDVDKYLT